MQQQLPWLSLAFIFKVMWAMLCYQENRLLLHDSFSSQRCWKYSVLFGNTSLKAGTVDIYISLLVTETYTNVYSKQQLLHFQPTLLGMRFYKCLCRVLSLVHAIYPHKDCSSANNIEMHIIILYGHTVVLTFILQCCHSYSTFRLKLSKKR